MTTDPIRLMTAGLAPEDVGFDEDGAAVVAIGDGLAVGIEHIEDSGELLLHADLGLLPQPIGAGDLAAALLDENLRLAATDIGTVGVDRATGTVALVARRTLAGLAPEAFEDWLGAFAEAAQIWAARIAEQHPRPAAEEPPVDDLELDMVLLGTA